MGDPNGGRIMRGWHLLGVGCRVLLDRPRLLVFPALSTLLLSAAAVVVFIPWASTDDVALTTLLPAAAIVAFPATAAAVFCNVGFVAMVQQHLAGEEPRVRSGLVVARRLLGPILRWSLLSVVVGALFRGIAAIPGGDLLGSVISWLGGLAWSLATYFVLPVLVIEQVGVIDGVKRSVAIFKQRWGESLVGEMTAGAATGILSMPGVFLLVFGVVIVGDAPGVGLTLLAIGVVLTVPVLVLGSAITQMFQLVVYREVADGAPPSPFTATDTAAAFKPRRRWLRRG